MITLSYALGVRRQSTQLLAVHRASGSLPVGAVSPHRGQAHSNRVGVGGLDATEPDLPALRFAAMLKAARDFGLDQSALNAIALRFDARRPDLAHIADALAEALLAHRPLDLPDAA